MKRKIIKQGRNTLTVTLPKDWTDKHSLTQGDEIDFIERESGLLLNVDSAKKGLRAEIDITSFDIPTIWKFFMAMYREGYDEIKVNFDHMEQIDSPYKYFTNHRIDMKFGKNIPKNKPIEAIQHLTNRFIGYEVIEHHPTYCVIKDMSDFTGKEFDGAIKRVFRLLLQMAEIIEGIIKNNEWATASGLHDIDIDLDKFHDYCIRVMNKTHICPERKSRILFSILFMVELMGDEFKNIGFHLMEDLKGKTLKQLHPPARHLVESLKLFEQLFDGYDEKILIELSKIDYENYFYLPKMRKLQPAKYAKLSEKELEVLHHFRGISRFINGLTELVIEMRY